MEWVFFCVCPGINPYAHLRHPRWTRTCISPEPMAAKSTRGLFAVTGSGGSGKEIRKHEEIRRRQSLNRQRAHTDIDLVHQQDIGTIGK